MSIARFEKTFVFAVGAAGYGACEILWRGYTHFSMLILGGMCFLGLYAGQKKYYSLSLPLRCFAGGIFITSMELVAGCIINIAFGWNVWDYSDMPFNFYGQICPQFFAAWVMLCIPALKLCEVISDRFRRLYV